jgi:hypothetical protein
VHQVGFIYKIIQGCLVNRTYKIELLVVMLLYEQDMWRVWGRIEVCTGCWWGSLRERGHWGDQDVDMRIILRWIFRKLEEVVGTGWIGSG